MTDRPILETENLSMHFGGVVAVDSVSLSVAEGELRCLIGPNGAGKSTFFKCLTGQLHPTAGRIRFRGEDITREGPHRIARRGIGIKTQVPSVFNALTVDENLWLATRRHHGARATRDRVATLLERLSLTDIAARTVGTLAHGQRQWVELGLVLASEPSLILLDEPAAGMTHDEVSRTAELIREINRSAVLIVVEHDMQFIRMIARTITVLHQGTVLIEDEAETVMRDPRVKDVYLGREAAA